MYDTETLLEKLKNVGFNARKREAFDSDIDGIENIEIKERTLASVIVEGTKDKTLLRK